MNSLARSAAALLAFALGATSSGTEVRESRLSSFLAQPSMDVPSAYGHELREYITQSGSMELLAIRSAEVALRRSRDDRVTSAARRALRTHEGLSAQLSFVGRRLNVLPAATLLPQHEQMLLQLINSTHFDATYILQQRAMSISAYRLHSAYLRTGKSPTLRAVARKAVALATSELQQLRRL